MIWYMYLSLWYAYFSLAYFTYLITFKNITLLRVHSRNLDKVETNTWMFLYALCMQVLNEDAGTYEGSGIDNVGLKKYIKEFIAAYKLHYTYQSPRYFFLNQLYSKMNIPLWPYKLHIFSNINCTVNILTVRSARFINVSFPLKSNCFFGSHEL